MIAATIVSICMWNNPGANRYVGDPVHAVMNNFKDLDYETRYTIAKKMQRHEYDDFVTIRRDSIEGGKTYHPYITDMMFGKNIQCEFVDRLKWRDSHLERGMIYCHKDNCLIVPTVCGNVARVYTKHDDKTPTTPKTKKTHVNHVPEPSTGALIMVALTALIWCTTRRKSVKQRHK